MSLFFIGYRGSGKTTLGRMVAQRLLLPFYDNDDQVVARAGKSIREIFAEAGEARFRDLETEALRELDRLDHCVISLGGGIVEREENIRLLQDRSRHRVIYLRCEPAELLRRIQGDAQSRASRPNLTSLGGGIEEVTTVLSRREPLYRALMTIELDVTRLTPAQVCDEVVRSLVPADVRS